MGAWAIDTWFVYVRTRVMFQVVAFVSHGGLGIPGPPPYTRPKMLNIIVVLLADEKG